MKGINDGDRGKGGLAQWRRVAMGIACIRWVAQVRVRVVVTVRVRDTIGIRVMVRIEVRNRVSVQG